MIRVCLIGCGTIARVHLKALQSLSGTAVQVVGLVDPIHESAISLKKEITRHGEECQVSICSEPRPFKFALQGEWLKTFFLFPL